MSLHPQPGIFFSSSLLNRTLTCSPASSNTLYLSRIEKRSFSQSLSHVLCCLFVHEWSFRGKSVTEKEGEKSKVPEHCAFEHPSPFPQCLQSSVPLVLLLLPHCGSTAWAFFEAGPEEENKKKLMILSGQRDSDCFRIFLSHPCSGTPSDEARSKREKKKKKAQPSYRLFFSSCSSSHQSSFYSSLFGILEKWRLYFVQSSSHLTMEENGSKGCIISAPEVPQLAI